MNIINYTAEEYNFNKAMQHNINENIQPLLISHNFTKFSPNKYVRELDGLLQFIYFNVGKERVKAFAFYIPIYFPYDNLLSFGIEITGSSGISLLQGKYFPTLYEREKHNKMIQWEDYNKVHLPNIEKLIYSIKEGILPEKDRIGSLADFINVLECERPIFFGEEYDIRSRNGVDHRYIMAVYKCLTEEYGQGVIELKELKRLMEEDVSKGLQPSVINISIKEYLEHFLNSIKSQEVYNSAGKEEFKKYFDTICNERRKKYKLLNSYLMTTR
jgi:hypothetical protein